MVDINTNKIELIKYLSIFSMLIDHIGVIYFEGNEVFRFIGRFALIGFAFVLTYNYRFNTQDKKTYKYRILIWAIISQIPFMLIFNNPFQINILFLFYISLVAIDQVDNIIKTDKVFIPVILLSASLIISLLTGYFFFGLALIVLMYYEHDAMAKDIKSLLVYRLLLLSVVLLNFNLLYGVAAFISLSIIDSLKINTKIPRINKYFFYAFYPVHLLLLWSLS